MPNFPNPTWAAEVSARYSSRERHAFILHGNVEDLVAPETSLPDFLSLLGQATSPELIVFYDRAHGFSFPIPAMEDKFRMLAGLPRPNAQQQQLQAAAGVAPRLPNAPIEALNLINRALLSSEGANIVVIIRWAETIIPPTNGNGSPEDRASTIFITDWGNDAVIGNTGSLIIMTTTDIGALNAQVTAPNSGWAPVAVELPDDTRRAAFLDAFDTSDIEWQMSRQTFVAMTASLSLRHMEQMINVARYRGTMTIELAQETKAALVKAEYGDLVRFIEPNTTFADIGGLEHIKAFLLKYVVAPIRAGKTNRVPKGILLTGPAGTGKTAIVKAFAAEVGLKIFDINIGQVFGSLQGQTESTMRRMLRMIESAAPCIVWIDEIDQSVSRQAGGDNGAAGRVFQQLLQFMSEERLRGKVVVMAATNRPDLMDAAMRRAGRFDYKIPFPVPNQAERLAIMTIYGRNLPGFNPANISAASLAMTEGWTGAAIRQAMEKAIAYCEDDGLPADAAIARAIARTKDTTQDVDAMWALALTECNDLDLLPPGYEMPDSKILAEKAAALPAKRERRSLI